MYKVFFSILAFCAALALPVDLPAQSKKPAAKKQTTAKKSTHGRTPARRGSTGQQAPSAARYREIQKALADRGYLKEEPNGVWGPASIEALRRFQEDQNLRASGRLDPVSLIALGLGPKRDSPDVAGTAEEKP